MAETSTLAKGLNGQLKPQSPSKAVMTSAVDELSAMKMKSASASDCRESNPQCECERKF